MSIEKLDHVNLRTTQLDTMINWYRGVLGLRVGDRPDFPFPGAWLYAGETVVLHLVGTEGTPGVGSERGLKLEHFALSARNRTQFEARFQAMGEPYRRIDIPSICLIQLNLWDPDGNHLHLDFQAHEKDPVQTVN
jgi:catechol 2,3-dioxygenase-like lactoylglutathione lyase family enzyme